MRRLPVILLILLLCGCRSSRPAERTPFAPQERQKQIFLVMDDAGLDRAEIRPLLDIPVPMTIAVLPHLKHTSAVCDLISRYPDKEIILHQPMEAYNPDSPTGPGAIRQHTKPGEIAAILEQNLASVRGAVGINNHMGSRITEDESLMAEILAYCRRNDLFFLDSKTAYNSLVPRVAGRMNIHLEERDVFLDIQRDRDTVRQAWESTVAKAKENGYVIAIGHVWSAETAAAIRGSCQTLINQGYSFHRLSELYE